MHPRFFTMLDDVELCGVGLSCEKTCELLLGDEKDLVFYIEDTEEELSFSEVLAVIGLNLPNGVFKRISTVILKKSAIIIMVLRCGMVSPVLQRLYVRKDIPVLVQN